jgi:hypothetical protein
MSKERYVEGVGEAAGNGRYRPDVHFPALPWTLLGARTLEGSARSSTPESLKG